MDTTEQIKDYIASGEPDKAIQLLLEYAKKDNPDIYDEALILSGQYSKWKREVTLGIQESHSDLRRIEVGIIDILNDEESFKNQATPQRTSLVSAPSLAATQPVKKSNLSSILLGVFGTISALFVFIMLSGDDEPVATTKETPPAVVNQAVAQPTQQQSEEETVLGGNLTPSQFDQMISSYQEMNKPIDAPRLDINTVIQVRYAYENENGFFDKITNTDKWVERDGNTQAILHEYKELSRDNQNSVISLYKAEDDRYIFIDIKEDRIYEQMGDDEKNYIFSIVGVL